MGTQDTLPRLDLRHASMDVASAGSTAPLSDTTPINGSLSVSWLCWAAQPFTAALERSSLSTLTGDKGQMEGIFLKNWAEEK